MGLTALSLKLNGMCPDGQYVLLDNVVVTPSVDSRGMPISVSINSHDKLRSDQLKLYTWNWDKDAATKIVKFILNIRAAASIENVDIGYGQLFPK